MMVQSYYGAVCPPCFWAATYKATSVRCAETEAERLTQRGVSLSEAIKGRGVLKKSLGPGREERVSELVF